MVDLSIAMLNYQRVAAKENHWPTAEEETTPKANLPAGATAPVQYPGASAESAMRSRSTLQRSEKKSSETYGDGSKPCTPGEHQNSW